MPDYNRYMTSLKAHLGELSVIPQPDPREKWGVFNWIARNIEKNENIAYSPLKVYLELRNGFLRFRGFNGTGDGSAESYLFVGLDLSEEKAARDAKIVAEVLDEFWWVLGMDRDSEVVPEFHDECDREPGDENELVDEDDAFDGCCSCCEESYNGFWDSGSPDDYDWYCCDLKG